MAVVTTTVNLTADTWTQISTGQANVLVQRLSGIIRVAVKATAPSGAVGHILDDDQSSISFGSLAATDLVWALSSNEAQKIVVTA
ncbi:hypothetical protein EVC13_033 [Rhizobium phage RHph_I65]|nr:hypothetical protein EVC13_033 [Rhizobium phage RHph_I65]